MHAILLSLVDAIREDLGHPVRLLRLLAEATKMRAALDVQPMCIALSSVPKWHELGAYIEFPHRKRGELLGWRESGGRWESFLLERPEFAQMGHLETTEGWSVDLTAIDGFGASKSDLYAFASTDEMVEAKSREMIREITLEGLAKNLAHSEIRIIHEPGTFDHFVRYLWDGRLWLRNGGGSHHTAAAKYIAARLGRSVKLTGALRTYSLNELSVAALRRDFEMFVINDSDPFAADAFFQSMQSFRATWLWHTLPRPYEEGFKAILLPRNEGRSMRVATELRKAGFDDLGVHLASLVWKQAQCR
ncbi:hypothetical protein N5J07_09315 [Comamonas aquatica]|uniref:DUF6685 family protein n=1 Tax=Comamonas aquatica TaxID=225991 RepID=UPI00244C480E|nr:DUF6685 family protein [Comamonas aquatica]MDH1379646.1 hypothetical protein [Comamonas aquatica]MDH1639613.1 hypothetical protein [Comamonas aquatica]